MFAENFLDRLPGVGGGLGKNVRKCIFTIFRQSKGEKYLLLLDQNFYNKQTF
jgi:hypothetical protein